MISYTLISLTCLEAQRRDNNEPRMEEVQVRHGLVPEFSITSD